MAKINLPTVTDSTNVSTMNSNFQAIADELNNKALYRDNPVGEPNQSENDIDLNSNDLLNAKTVNTEELFVDGTRVTVTDVDPASNFLNLVDVDETTYSGFQGQLSTVNAVEDGLEFVERKYITPGVVHVTQASDLAGTLDSSTLYIVVGAVDMGSQSIEVPTTGLTITGNGANVSSLISSEDGYELFSETGGGSGDLIISKLTLTVTGSGSSLFANTAATVGSLFSLEDVFIQDCTSMGYLDGFFQGLESVVTRRGGTPELEFRGAWGGGYLATTTNTFGLTDGAYSLFKAGSGFTMQTRFKTNINLVLPATAAFFDFSDTNFPNPSSLEIQEAIVSRNGLVDATDTTITPNIDATNLSCAWVNNVGVGNTHPGGCVNVGTEVTTVISSIGTFVDLNGVYVAGDLQHFDNPSLGQLRHLGNDPRDYNVSIVMDIDGSSNDELELKLVKWDNSASSFVDVGSQKRTVNNFQGGRDVAFFVDALASPLDINDYFKLQIANNTSTDNVTVEQDGFMRVSER